MHLLDERLMRETKAIRRRKAYRAGDNKFNWNDGPGHFIWNYRIEPKEIEEIEKEREREITLQFHSYSNHNLAWA